MTVFKNKLVFVTSLGCSKNWVDTEIMMAHLLEHQFGFTDSEKSADVWLINTCGFIASARTETESFINKAIKWKKKNIQRKIVIAGCINAYDTEKVYPKRFPEVDLWLQIDEITRLGERLEVLLADGKQSDQTCGSNYLYDHHTARLQLTPEHYAYLKITDGCDNHCSYCAIPHIRGKSRSRTIESVVIEAQNLIANGVKELILIGQDITRFGYDLTGKGELVPLLKQLDQLEGDFVIRLLYLHPARYPDELTDLYATSQHLLPYLEMPVQHIAQSILDSMNRQVSKERIIEILKNLKKRVPHIALRTTFILGYPTETPEAFEELLDFVKTIEFDRVGAFVFQVEPNTPAAKLSPVIEPQIAQKRYDQLMALQNSIALKKNQSLLGQTVRVLIDEVGEEIVGRTYRDAPEIDNVIYINPKRRHLRQGEWVDVKIVDVAAYEMLGEILPQKSDRKK